jgi:hypothetical protein
VHIEGVLEINMREFAPFLALVVPIGPEWQRVDGNIAVHWAGTAAAGVPVSSLLRDQATEVQATVQVSAVLPELRGYGKDLAVKTTGTLSGNARLIHWTLAAGGWATAMVGGAAVKGIEPLSALSQYGPQPVRLDNAQESTGELFWTESPPRFTSSGPVRISYGAQSGPVYVECMVTQIIGRGFALDHADARVRAKGGLPPAWHQRLHVKQLKGELQGDVTWTGTALRGTLNPSSTATFTEFKLGPLRMSSGVFQLEEPFRVDFDVSAGHWSSGPGSWVWRSPRLRIGGSQMTMERVALKVERLEGSERTYHAQIVASLEGLLVRHSMARSAPLDLSWRIEADPEAVQSHLETRSRNGAIKMVTQLEHEWSTGHGTAHGVLEPVSFQRAKLRLDDLWSSWSYPLELTEGSVGGTFDWRWTTAQQELHMQGGSADITVDRVGGRYQDFAFSGVNTKLKAAMEGFERVAISRPAEVTVASVQTGVEVTGLSMTVEGEWDLHEKLPLVEVRNIRCALLGGTATSQGVRADLGYPPFGLIVLVRELDLQRILSLEQQKGLQGTGILDGSIPLMVTSQGLSVKDGSLEARPPGGVIRYTATPEAAHAVTQANANMQVVLHALGNFHYDVLQVGAQYAENGTLHLRARLEGKNPDQKKSPPIHLNLTVQENIPALLKSLRLVNQLENSVRERFAGS